MTDTYPVATTSLSRTCDEDMCAGSGLDVGSAANNLLPIDLLVASLAPAACNVAEGIMVLHGQMYSEAGAIALHVPVREGNQQGGGRSDLRRPGCGSSVACNVEADLAQASAAGLPAAHGSASGSQDSSPTPATRAPW